jgi:hypothetical protein
VDVLRQLRGHGRGAAPSPRGSGPGRSGRLQLPAPAARRRDHHLRGRREVRDPRRGRTARTRRASPCAAASRSTSPGTSRSAHGWVAA